MATSVVYRDDDYPSVLESIDLIKVGNKYSSKVLAIPLSKPQKVVVAIPAYNEEIAIGSVVLRSLAYADKVVVINDGSKDKTSLIAKLAGADVIEHTTNGGKGSAIKDAFNYAKLAHADILVLIDGDGQHNPDEIPLLLAPVLSGEADIVNGSRFLNGKSHNVPKYRRMGQEVLTLATNTGTKLPITDTQNGFRAFSKDTFKCFSFQQNGMAIESEMLMDAAGANLRIKEVPINVRYDVEGSTYNPLTHGLNVMFKVISLVSQKRPLLFFMVMGAVLLSLGIFFALTYYGFDAIDNISVLEGIAMIFCSVTGLYCIFTGLTLSFIQKIKTVTK